MLKPGQPRGIRQSSSCSPRPTFVESDTGWPETLPATQYSTPPKTRTPLNYGELVDSYTNFEDGQEGSVERAADMMAKLQAAANLPDLSKVGKGRGNKVKEKQEQLIEKFGESAKGLGSRGAQPNANQS